jgi:hypothetical protein
VPILAATNKCLAQINKSGTRGETTKKHESRSPRRCDPVRLKWDVLHPHGRALDCGKTKHKKASIMKFVLSDICREDYKKRRSVFLRELIASTPNVSLRAKEFRRWIDENSPCSDNDEA